MPKNKIAERGRKKARKKKIAFPKLIKIRNRIKPKR